MVKRYQVFVSSTYQDLSEERIEVIKALLELDCIPCGMEYFPAANEEQWEYIQNIIDDCDYYILIIGGRYGSLTPDGISYTEKEYRYALHKNIPIISFLHANPDDLPSKKVEKLEDNKRKLDDFISLVKTKLCKEWKNTSDLGAVVSRSLTQLIKRYPRVGWVKADTEIDLESAQEILRLTKQIKTLEDQITALKGNQIADIDKYSQGEDIFLIEGKYTIVDKSVNYYNPEIIEKDKHCSLKLTWDQIFFKIAPLILDKTLESIIKQAVNRILSEAKKNEIELKNKPYEIGRLTTTEDTFQTIKIQFSVLGYIDIEIVNKENKARDIWWSLTPLGEKKMLSLRAIRKDSKSSTKENETSK